MSNDPRHYVWGGEMRHDPPTPEEDAAFKEGVRQQCLANGGDAELCELVADRVFNTPSEKDDPNPATCMRAHVATARSYLDTLSSICAMFGAQTLVPEFRRADMPLREVAALLNNTTGSETAITDLGKDKVRAYLAANSYWQQRSNRPC